MAVSVIRINLLDNYYIIKRYNLLINLIQEMKFDERTELDKLRLIGKRPLTPPSTPPKVAKPKKH